MKISTTQIRLEELSEIKYEVHMGKSSEVNYVEIMILKFIGVYGFGSAGNSDAIFMRAIGEAVLEAWEPGGLIIDLSELSYEWGDQLESVFAVGSYRYRDMPFPIALIVGDKSEEAIRTLIVGVRGSEGINEIGWVFREVSDAWNYIETKLKEYDSQKLL
ncbi:hypothetical protein [Lysinibacillus sp. 3P01SB]|uniref:hypothetical protein n=1 Tax=Lysinibacillus sp. 3P01SB TaxID=3132284 RepID=UPI0039A462C4